MAELTASAVKCITKRLAEYVASPVDGVQLDLVNEDDLSHIIYKVCPTEGPYADCEIEVTFQLPVDYPFKSPKIVGISDVVHSAFIEGFLRADGYSPASTFITLGETLLAAFTEDNFEFGLNPSLYTDDPEGFMRKVRIANRGGTVDGHTYDNVYTGSVAIDEEGNVVE